MASHEGSLNLKAVVLAGGSGTRLRPITHSVPKQLIPVGLRPVLGHVLTDIASCGIDESIIITSPESRDHVAMLLDREDFGLNSTIIVQDEPNGLAAAYGLALPYIDGDHSLLYLGDCLVTGGASDLVEQHRDSGADATLMVTGVDDPSRYGIVELDTDGNITALVEKPAEPRSNLAIVGVYAFGPSIAGSVAAIEPSARGEYEITDAVQHLVSDGGTVRSAEMSGWWIDTGTVADVLAANRRLLEALPDSQEGDISATEVSGNVVIEAGAKVRGSTLNGPLVVRTGATIEDSEVSAGTHIGRDVSLSGARISNSIVMDGSGILDTRIEQSIIGPRARVAGLGHQLLVELVVGADAVVGSSSSQAG